MMWPVVARCLIITTWKKAVINAFKNKNCIVFVIRRRFWYFFQLSISTMARHFTLLKE